MDQVEALLAPLGDLAVDVGTRIVGAILLWIVGKVLIGLAKRGVGAALSRRSVDPTLARYDNYWQVYFDTNRTIREAFGAKGYDVPSQHLDVRTGA